MNRIITIIGLMFILPLTSFSADLAAVKMFGNVDMATNDLLRVRTITGTGPTAPITLTLSNNNINIIGTTALFLDTAGAIEITALSFELQSAILQDPADPTAANEVGDRDYNDARYLTLAGGTMTGDITMGAGSDLNLSTNTITAGTNSEAMFQATGSFTDGTVLMSWGDLVTNNAAQQFWIDLNVDTINMGLNDGAGAVVSIATDTEIIIVGDPSGATTHVTVDTGNDSITVSAANINIEAGGSNFDVSSDGFTFDENISMLEFSITNIVRSVITTTTSPITVPLKASGRSYFTETNTTYNLPSISAATIGQEFRVDGLGTNITVTISLADTDKSGPNVTNDIVFTGANYLSVFWRQTKADYWQRVYSDTN